MTTRKTTKSKTASARTAAPATPERGAQTKRSQTAAKTKTKKSARKPAAKPPSKAKASRPKTAPSHSNKTTNQIEPHAKGLNTSPVNRDMLLFALPHPIFVLDSAQRFIYISAAAEAFFEISTPMLKRMALDDIVNFSSPLRALVDQVLKTGSTVNEYAVEISTNRFENTKLVDVYAGPIPEQPELTVVMLLQRTMAQMIERQLTHRAAARSVSGMAAVLAHEIKNPLSGIRGAAQLLEQNLSDEDRVFSRLICTETDRITKLVDRMEVFGDERPISTEPVNIHEILAHVRTLAQAGFAKGVQIFEDYDPSLPPVPGDRDQLIQAFLNLLKNAVEALPGDSKSDRITIQTAFRPGIRLTLPSATTRVSLPLMIQIEDNGKGIPEHLKSHLFDPFVTTKIGGTGLGLALVAKIIGDHGGVIECESDNNRTIFRVLLALQPTPAQTHAP